MIALGPTSYLRGTTLRAGLGVSTILPCMDFETYSPAGFVWDSTTQKWGVLPNATKKGLPVVGTVRYTEDPDAEVLCLAYDLKNGRGKQLWVPGQADPHDLFTYLQAGGLIEAWNSFFEYCVWNNICCKRYGWSHLYFYQLRDAMAKARAFALPGGLANAAQVLGTQNQKDKRGMYLLNKFSIPRNPTKNSPSIRNLPRTEDPDTQDLYNYCLQDITTESEISQRVPDLSPDELRFWLCDQAINIRGVQIDVEGIKDCIAVIEQAYVKYNTRLQQITNGEVKFASEVAKIIRWLNKQNIPVTSLDEESVTKLISYAAISCNANVFEVLNIRQLISYASVKKLYAMLNQVSSKGRLHNIFVYHSARTGRAAGAGPQPQNLPNSGPEVLKCDCGRHAPSDYTLCPWCGFNKGGDGGSVEWNSDAAEDALVTLSTRSLDCVEMFWNNAIEIVSSCLRSLFVAAPGYDLLCSDYKAIEAVVLAAIAGEEWRLEVFRTHGMIYEMSASKITGIPFAEFERHKRETGQHHPLRKKVGKVAELASGYQGWIGAWKQFGAEEFFNDEEMKQAILAWRNASPKIVEMWGGQQRNGRPEFYGLEGCAIQAVQFPNIEFSYHGITYLCCDDILYCRLLSGRNITYHHPQLSFDHERRRWRLSFHGWNTNPKNGSIGWTRMDTFGGKLTENVVQATARDILAHAIVNLEHAGYPVVLHVHDEIVCEVPEVSIFSVSGLEQIMSTMPPWAKDWPIYASGGWRGKRYRK